MIPSRRFNPDIFKGKGGWTVPNTPRSIELLNSIGFKIKEGKKEEVDRPKAVAVPPTAWKELTLDNITDKARDYQIDGIKQMKAFNYNCLLADEAGSGKSLMAISAIRSADIYPVLIVCPSSLKLNWKKEIKMWGDPKHKNSYYVVQGKKKQNFKNYQFVILNYDVLFHHVGYIMKEFKPKILIADEIHEGKSIPKIVSRYYPEYKLKKNEMVMIREGVKKICTQPAKRVRALNWLISGLSPMEEAHAGFKWNGINHKLLLTATPLPNNASEIYNILHWLDPKRFNDLDKFLEYFCVQEEGFKRGIKVIKKSKNLDVLHKILIENYMIRRKKKDILKELPPRQKTVIPLMMEDKWWREYVKADEDFVNWIKENKRKNIQTEEQERSERFNTLQEIALNGKLKGSFEFIDNLMLNPDQKILIFCHHKKTVQKVMDRYKGEIVKLVGGMSDEAKEEAKEQFQTNPKIRYMVLNIKAGSVGHTLTAADKVVFLETYYLAHLIDQSVDRIHRLSQTSDSVMAYFLQAAGSIEKLIINMIDRKLGEMNKAIDGVETEESEMLQYLWEAYEKRTE